MSSGGDSLAANGPQAKRRGLAWRLACCYGLAYPLRKPLVNAGLTIFPNIYLVRSELCPYIWAINEQRHAMTYHNYPSKFVTWFRQTYGVRHPELAVRKLNAMTSEELTAVQVAYRAAIA